MSISVSAANDLCASQPRGSALDATNLVSVAQEGDVSTYATLTPAFTCP
jgi:hypothetical protein